MSDQDHKNHFESPSYTVKPIPGSGAGSASREASVLREFLNRIQDFPFGGSDRENEYLWRIRAPVIITGSLLLFTMLLAFIWIIKFRGGLQASTIIQFNLHPIFMIAGFFVFSGFSMLFYRTLTWYDKLTVKLLHTAFHFLSVVSVAIAYTAAKTSMAYALPDKPSFCSLHSWLGLATMILFFSQFALGFGSFIVAYFMCETRSSSWRADLLPNHATLGLITFVMAAATAVTGLTEKAIFTLKDLYIMGQVEEELYVNLLGTFIVLATIAIVFTLRDDRTKRGNQPNIYNIRNFN